MGNKASKGAAQGAMPGAPSGAYKGPSGSYAEEARDTPQYTYATKSQLNAKIKNGSFNPETDFALMTTNNTNPRIVSTYGFLDDNVQNKLEERIFVLFPPPIRPYNSGGARKRRRKTKKTIKRRKTRKLSKK